MSTSEPPGNRPSFAEENAMKIASESISHYDAEADVYHASYGPPIPAVSIPDEERELLVRVDPATGQVVGFSIPNFKEWHAANADEDGGFEIDLPSVWPMPGGEGATDAESDEGE